MSKLKNLTMRKKILLVEREISIIVNKPNTADEFIPKTDNMNILVHIELTPDECNHSRAGLRIRRKLSPIFTQHSEKIVPNYSIVHLSDKKPYLRAEFHCHTHVAGKRLYKYLVKEFFMNK